jgi:myo-inositol-1(or 4)-monophosphatase
MSELLSTSGNRLLGLCDDASRAVASSIRDMIGTASGGQMVNMGADGTPTKVIDRAAENAVLDVLQSSGMGFLVLSEERGEVTIGENPDHFLHLDPLDGTFNAISGIPFYALSIYISGHDCRLGYIYDLARGQRFYAEAGRGAYAGSGERICVSRNEDFKNFSISAYTIRPTPAA